MPDIITSAQNTQLKLVRKLARRRSRQLEGAFVVFGEDIVQAGLQTGARPRALFVDATRASDLELGEVECPVEHVEPRLLADLSEMPHPPRVIAIFDALEELTLTAALGAKASQGDASEPAGPWIALDGLVDPGNVGTIVRTAAAMGAGGVITLPGTADPFGAKATRASMGACFRVPIVRLDDPACDVAAQIDAARAAEPRLRVVALDAAASTELHELTLDDATIVVVGGERAGVSDALRDAADELVSIRQNPAVESVNAGVAASIALYEWSRGQTKEHR